MERNNLFELLDGTVAHLLIIVGLALTLFTPVLTHWKVAEVKKAQAQLSKINGLIEFEMDQFKNEQGIAPTSSSTFVVPSGARTEDETNRSKAEKDKKSRTRKKI